MAALAALAASAFGCLEIADESYGDVDDPAKSAAQWSTETIAGMRVHLYTPQTAPALADKRALMIGLHGCAQTNDDMRAGGNWEATADAYGMVVALPGAPDGGVIAGCWDYYESNHTRSNRHNDNLINLATTLMGRSSLNIDTRQVYVSGLSSGGGETMVMGCLAPDIFAGVGINAGPTIGTTSGQISYIATDKTRAVNLCRQLAGSNEAHLQTQVTSVVYGSNDYLVSQGYGDLNAAVMGEIYGATKATQAQSIPGGGAETPWSKNGAQVVQQIRVTGLGHAWPAGPGSTGGGPYIDHVTVNYPAVLTDFLFCANRRVPGAAELCGAPLPDPDPQPGPQLYCGTDTNANHHAAARAIRNGIVPFENYSAVGSYQYMGAGSATVTRLKETQSGYFVVATSCP
jgi:poly(3-hydroxybutyrate) depolymerase